MTEASAVPFDHNFDRPLAPLFSWLSRQSLKKRSAFICSFDAGIVPSNLFLRGIFT